MKNTDNITVNMLELASELAHKRVVESNCHTIWIDEDEQTIYTEEAQDLFNEYHDQYETIILECKIIK